MINYFGKRGRRDGMIPEIAKSSWSRCYGALHATEQDRWYRPWERGFFHLIREQFFCSQECAVKVGDTPNGEASGQ